MQIIYYGSSATANILILDKMGRCLVIMVTIYGLISDKRASYLKAEKWVFRTIFLIITMKFRKFVWNQGVTNLNYFYYDYYSQKNINSKITSTMSCVEGKDQRNVGNLFWKLQPLLICGLRLANFSLSLMRLILGKWTFPKALWCSRFGEFVVKSMKMARTDDKTDVRIVKLSDGVEFWNQDIPDPSSSLSTNVDVFIVS